MRGKKLLCLLLGVALGSSLSVGFAACNTSDVINAMLGSPSTSSETTANNNNGGNSSNGNSGSSSNGRVDKLEPSEYCGVYYWEKFERWESGEVVSSAQVGDEVDGEVLSKDLLKLIVRTDGTADLGGNGDWACLTYSNHQTYLDFEDVTATYSEGNMIWSYEYEGEWAYSGVGAGTIECKEIYYWKKSSEAIPAEFCYGCGQEKETTIVDWERFCDSCLKIYEENNASNSSESTSSYDDWGDGDDSSSEYSSSYDYWSGWDDSTSYGSSEDDCGVGIPSYSSSDCGSSDEDEWIYGSSEYSSSDEDEWDYSSSEYSSSRWSGWDYSSSYSSSEYSSSWDEWDYSSSEYSSSSWSGWDYSLSESSTESSSDGVIDDSSFDDSDYETDCVTYEISEDGKSASVTGYTGTPTKVKILSTYQGVSVTSIDYYAFSSCSSLTSVVIPDSVTSIGTRAFEGCSSLTSINVSENNANYKSIDGNLYSKDGTTLIRYAIGKTATEFTIPNSVTSIGGCAFYNCSRLTSVVIGGGVTSIGGCAFYNCSRLTSVVIPDSVTSVGYEAFYGCTRLTIYCEAASQSRGWDSYWYKEGYSSWCPVVWDCNNNDVADDGYIYTMIDGIRYGIKDGEATVVRQSSNNIQTANIPTSITYKNTIYSVTGIGEYAFSGCSSLTSVVIPDNVTSIGNFAFKYCSRLTSIEIPDRVTSIGWCAFYGCSSLTSVVIGDSVTSIDSEAFKYCSRLMSIEIPDSVTNIGYQVFHGCSSLTSVVIGDSVTSINKDTFSGCSSLEYTIKDGLKYLGNTNNPYLWLMDTETTDITTATIENACKFIGSSAFSGCSSLTSVVIPDSVTSIGWYAFSGCSSLTSVVIGNSVASIGWYAFYECSSLTSIEIPDSVTSIGDDAFWSCSHLTSVVIGDSATSIGGSAFYECSSLTSVYYNGTIDDWAQISFGDYSANPLSYAKNLYIDNELVTGAKITTATKISDYAFYKYSSLTSVVLPDSVTSIGDYAFYYCSSLTSVVIPDSVTSIGGSAFYECSSLTSVVIPDSVTSIGGHAFAYCSSLRSVVIGNSVTRIWSGAFNDCYNLKSVYYNGTESEWSEISSSWSGLTRVTRYYYSEEQPTEEGNYWHYVDGVVMKW